MKKKMIDLKYKYYMTDSVYMVLLDNKMNLLIKVDDYLSIESMVDTIFIWLWVWYDSRMMPECFDNITMIHVERPFTMYISVKEMSLEFLIVGENESAFTMP